MEVEIPLYQDLFNFSKVITHLDNRKLLVTNDNVLDKEGLLLVRNEGMYSPNGEKGHLFIHFKTKFPNLKKLEDNEKDVLKKLLIKCDYEYYKEEGKIDKTDCIKLNCIKIDKDRFDYGYGSQHSQHRQHSQHSQHSQHPGFSQQQNNEEGPGCTQQ